MGFSLTDLYGFSPPGPHGVGGLRFRIWGFGRRLRPFERKVLEHPCFGDPHMYRETFHGSLVSHSEEVYRCV